MQTFHFNSNFSSLKSLDFAPSMNEFFDNFTLATSTSGASAAATIGAGATLEINTAFSAQVTFATGNGLLKLDDPTSFTGQIAGIAGTGDVIDFAGFASNTTTASYSAGSGNLTVSDAAHSVSIKLVGDYSLSSFTVSSDGHGGVLVVDPPLNSSPPESHVVESGGRDQTLTGHSGSDTFMFKADFGNATIANFEPGVDVIEAEEALFATHEALFAATHDDGQGNVVIVVDQNNSITLNNVALIGLSQNLSDLHLV